LVRGCLGWSHPGEEEDGGNRAGATRRRALGAEQQSCCLTQRVLQWCPDPWKSICWKSDGRGGFWNNSRPRGPLSPSSLGPLAPCWWRCLPAGLQDQIAASPRQASGRVRGRLGDRKQSDTFAHDVTLPEEYLWLSSAQPQPGQLRPGCPRRWMSTLSRAVDNSARPAPGCPGSAGWAGEARALRELGFARR